MAIFKGGGGLQGNPAELVHIAINLIFVERYIKVETLSDNSGEGQVFLVEKDDKKLVLKVLAANVVSGRNVVSGVIVASDLKVLSIVSISHQSNCF